MRSKYLQKYKITVFEDGTIIGPLNKPIKGFFDKNGYRRISVRFLNSENIKVRKNKFVHRLVAEAFLENYSEKLVVNHLDCNNKNNHYTNLEMTTISGNTKHAVENNLLKIRGENSIFNKYSEEFAIKVLTLLKNVERLSNGNVKPGELIKIANQLNTTRQVVKDFSRKRGKWKYLNI